MRTVGNFGLALLFLPPKTSFLLSSRQFLRSFSIMAEQPPKHVVIAGGGILGTCTAYYLAKDHNISSTIVDVTGEIAPAASGKAGGFLALDWNDHGPTGALTRRSFALHQHLADTFGADTIQYRRLTCAAIAAASSSSKPKGAKLQEIEWAASGTHIQSLGDETTIAQVHPKLLAQTLFANTPNANLMKGRVVGECTDGAKLDDGTTVHGDALVYCCGPWTANVIFGVKYHSVVVPTKRVMSQSVFFSGHGDPEVYVRPDQTAYCTGFPEPARIVTESPGQEKVEQQHIERILDAVRYCSGQSEDLLYDLEKLQKQACYLPTTDDGIPVMGAIGKHSYIATGHSCWGILLAPASGEAMASLIANGKCDTMDLSPFQPQRYANMIMVPNHQSNLP